MSHYKKEGIYVVYPPKAIIIKSEMSTARQSPNHSSFWNRHIYTSKKSAVK